MLFMILEDAAITELCWSVTGAFRCEDEQGSNGAEQAAVYHVNKAFICSQHYIM